MSFITTKREEEIISLLEAMAKQSTDVKVDVQSDLNTDTVKAYFFYSFFTNETPAGVITFNDKVYGNIQRASVHMEMQPGLNKEGNPVNTLFVQVHIEATTGRYNESVTLTDYSKLIQYLKDTVESIFTVNVKQ